MHRGWVAVSSAIVALVGALAVVWWHSGESTAAALAGVAAAVFALSGPLGPVILEALRSPEGVPTAEQLAPRLAEVVRKQWERESELRGLHHPWPIVLRWSAASPRMMDHAEVIAGQDVASPSLRRSLAGQLNDVVEEFMRLPRRRLVVTGAPGAGKSVVFVQLTLGLLAQRRPEGAVPVLLTLSSWDPRREPLRVWMVRCIAHEYPFLRRSGVEALVGGGWVVPILDGLDELPHSLAAAALLAMNEISVQQPLVVACRSGEFAQAVWDGNVLMGAAVVELEPITPRVAREYLRVTTPLDRTGRWERAFVQLRPGSAVAAALSTPLMLSLARIVYAVDRAADPSELVDSLGTRDAIEGHLLDAFLPAVLRSDERVSKARRWQPEEAQRWLSFLATYLSESSTPDLAWWELLPGRPKSGLAVGLIAGLFGGLSFGIGGGLAFELLGGLLGGFWAFFLDYIGGWVAVAVFFGLLFGITFTVMFGRLPARSGRPTYMGFGVGRARGTAMMVGLGFGLLCAVIVGVAVGLVHGPGGGLGVGSAVGLVVGLGVWASGSRRVSDRTPSPEESFTADRVVTVVESSGGVVIGLLAGLVIGLVTQQLVIGLVFGIGGGLFWGLLAGLSTAWSRYQLSRAWLAMRGRIPWRLGAFLQHCHRLGVLRQVGSVYQFRHARLQDRLAGADPTTRPFP